MVPHRCTIQLVDVANGLKYMHDLLVVHGDLKGVRVFLNEIPQYLHPH